MAAYGDSAYGNSTGTSTCTSTSLTVNSGEKIVIPMTWRDEAGETITGVTFNGSSSGLSSHFTTTAVDDLQVAAWVGTGVSGSGVVVVTWSSAPTDAHIHPFAVSNAGTIGTPTVTQAGGGAVDAFISASLTSSGSDLLVGAAHLRGTSASPAATSPATLRENGESVFGSTGMSASRAGAGGSTTLEFTYTNGGFALARIILVNIADSGGGGDVLMGQAVL